MTSRAVILGLFGATLLCTVSFFNDMVMRGTFLVGNFLPITVFGGLLLYLLLLNPVLARVRRGAALSAGELSVIMALVLFACCIPGRGLMHQFTNLLMLPHHYLKTTPGWQGQPADIQAEQISDSSRLCERLRQCLKAPTGEWSALRPLLDGEFAATLDDAVQSAPPSPKTLRLVRERLNALIADPAAGEVLRRGQSPLPPYARRLREQPTR